MKIKFPGYNHTEDLIMEVEEDDSNASQVFLAFEQVCELFQRDQDGDDDSLYVLLRDEKTFVYVGDVHNHAVCEPHKTYYEPINGFYAINQDEWMWEELLL